MTNLRHPTSKSRCVAPQLESLDDSTPLKPWDSCKYLLTPYMDEAIWSREEEFGLVLRLLWWYTKERVEDLDKREQGSRVWVSMSRLEKKMQMERRRRMAEFLRAEWGKINFFLHKLKWLMKDFDKWISKEI